MMGFDKFIWFIGVVEYNDDPTHNGRVKVRAFNVHPPKGEDVPTKHLPWATVINGSFGVTQSIPSVGDWVIGFFIDGADCQHPMIIGGLPGTNLGIPGGTGLPDSDDYLPPEYIKNIGRPPLNSYIGAEDGEFTSAGIQAGSQKNGINTAVFDDDGDRVTFDEPNILTPEKNFDSRVVQSKEGNSVIVLSETDDGDGSTILISHSSGSAVQIDANGTIFVKSFGDTYNSTEGFEFNRIDKDSHSNIGGDWSIKVEGGSGRIEIQGDLDISCNNFNVDARASANIFAGNAVNISGGKVGLTASADDINIGALNQIKLQTVGIPGLKSGNIVLKAPLGDLNLDSFAVNMLSHSYIGITAFGLPDILALPPMGTPNILVPPPPKLPLSGIEINTPTYVNVTTGLRINLQTLGFVTSSAGISTTIQSGVSSSLIGAAFANVTSAGSATLFGGVKANVTGVVSASMFSGGKATVTGVANATVFSVGKAQLTGVAAADVFGVGKASVTAVGVASLNASGVAFIGGALTLLGTKGPKARPGRPSLPGIPALPTLPMIPWPAFVNLAEFAALVIPSDLDAVRPFTGWKAGNRIGVPQGSIITSRAPAK